MSNEKKSITTPELVGLIEALLNVDEGSLTVETRLVEVPAWDSMGVLLLMAEMDERFGIALSEAELANLRGVSDIVNVVKRAGFLTE